MIKSKNRGLIITLTMLLITIVIGTTYAFFSASGGSANNAIIVNATVLSNLGFTSANSVSSNNLVPVSSESPYFSRYPGTSASGCIDDVGNQICSIYEFTITNTASVAQTIYVDFVPSQNTFDNLYFAAFNTTAASAVYDVATGSSGSGNNFVLIPQTTSSNSTLGHQATKLTKNSTASINMPGLSTTLNAGGSVTYAVLVWLQETKSGQNNEQGGSFKAGINVSTGVNGNGVTGVIGARMPAPDVYTANIRNVNTTDAGLILLGSPIPNNITPYYSPETVMPALLTNFNSVFNQSATEYPFFLAHVVSDDTLWCYGDGAYSDYCIYESEEECRTAQGSGHEDDCYESTGVDRVTESYVGFVVTGSVVADNPGMTAGTYYLRGGDSGKSYNENRETLLSAFGSSYCSENNYEFSCYNNSLSAWAESSGRVGSGASVDWDKYCIVRDEGFAYCDIWD